LEVLDQIEATYGMFDVPLFKISGTTVMVAIGFAMQNISQNLVSGVILLDERAIKPGDVLEVEGRLVKA